MLNTPQPVIIRRDSGNRTILLYREYLKKELGIDSAYAQKLTERGRNGGLWKCEKINGNWYFDYDAIPNREPKCYRDKLPPLHELIGIKTKESAVEILTVKLKEYVQKQIDPTLIGIYMHEFGCSSETSIQLAESKTWLDCLLVLTKTSQHIEFGFERIGDVYEVACKVLAEKKLKGLKITNHLSLRRKVAEYITVPAENRAKSLIHGLVNNNNAAIIGKEKIYHPETGEEMLFDVHLAVIYSLWLNTGFGNKQFKITIHSEYEEMMKQMGMDAVSYQTLCKRTNQFDMKALFSRERDGNKVFNDNYLPYVAAERLQLANTMWGGDGSSTKLLYRTSNGTARSLMCYRVADIASRKVLGWCIYEGGDGRKGESEDVILSALKMAYKTAGVFACEFITDNGGGHANASLKNKLKMCFKKHNTITPGNSQENPAENIIKSMNNFGRRYNNWGGSSWDANETGNKANFDNLSVAELPSKDEAFIQALEWIENWNNNKGADGLSPNERYSANKNAKATSVSDNIHRFVFGNKTQRDLSYSRSFVDINFKGISLKYTIPNYDEVIHQLARKTGFKGDVNVNLYFDEKGCDIYNTEDEFICSCESTKKSHKSEFEQFDESWKNHKDLKERKESMVAKAETITTAVAESMEAVSYELLAKQKAVVKDDWEEINTSNIPLNINSTESEIEPTTTSTVDKSIEDKAFEDAYFGN